MAKTYDYCIIYISNYYSCSGCSLGSVRPSKTQNLFTLSWKSTLTQRLVHPAAQVLLIKNGPLQLVVRRFYRSIDLRFLEQTSRVLEPRPKYILPVIFLSLSLNYSLITLSKNISPRVTPYNICCTFVLDQERTY